MKFGLAFLALCFATGLGQAPKDHESTPAQMPNGAKCVAEMSNIVPSKVLNQYTEPVPQIRTGG